MEDMLIKGEKIERGRKREREVLRCEKIEKNRILDSTRVATRNPVEKEREKKNKSKKKKKRERMMRE